MYKRQQQDYAQSDEEEEPTVEENLLFTANGKPTFFIEAEEYVEKISLPSDKNFILENYHELEVESDDYQRVFLNALSSQQRQYSLRSLYVPINPPLKKTVQQKEVPQKQVSQAN